MKPLLVFARIIIVGCLWSIVFIEGIRVIMLCNWHFDIFWGDHWRQFFDLWKAGWEIDAPKEWAFILILITFFPMLITGWWTLCLVAWEDIVRDVILFPYRIYQHFIKEPINVITTSNKYGVAKKKSYKQIRPAGVSKIYTPISEYGTENQPALPPAVAKASGYPSATPVLQYTPAQSFSTASNRVAAKVNKPDIPATIDHALFKFDDGDDDFDLDIDSFEKTDFSRPNKNSKPAKKPVYDDDDDDDVPTRSQKTDRNKPRQTFDFDDDDEVVANKNGQAKRQNREERGERDNSRDQNRNKQNRERNNKETRDNRDTRSQGAAQNNSSDSARSDAPHNPIYETLQQKGYDVITNITVNGTPFDFVGVSDTEVCLCYVDKETGDWLADEELFNGEDPLWFSEDSHRVSPVKRASKAQDKVYNALVDAGFNMIIKPYVVIQMANIINADDMFETWENLGVEVTRINRGMPKEIKLLSKSLKETEGNLNKKDLDNVRRVLKSLK